MVRRQKNDNEKHLKKLLIFLLKVVMHIVSHFHPESHRPAFYQVGQAIPITDGKITLAEDGKIVFSSIR
ncbi:MAG: hypothetical protein U0X76_09870 [Bacteroidia bacterium]